ncbi:MAG TPA: asparagine synthase-related protein [Vicinamibacterales bacterium]|nr:asparagine synthase-related protein [Vicinamibacterales bacterium]
MPGIAALIQPGTDDARALLDAMLRRMAHYPWLKADGRLGAGQRVGLGTVAHEWRSAASIATSTDGFLTVVLDGEFFTGHGAGQAAEFLAGWQAHGTALLPTLNGEFSAAIWDGVRQELHLVTDRFGLRSLYVAQPPGAFVAASEIKSILVMPSVDRAWSESGVSDFFGFGHFYSDNTLLRGVRAVPAATCGTYRLADGKYTETKYWTLPARNGDRSPAECAAAFDEAFAAGVRRRGAPGEKLGLSLSGGLDARTILGVMPDGLDLKTVSLGIDGSLDHKSAAEMAAIVHVPHRQFFLDASFLAGFEPHLREMVLLTDGHYLDQGLVMPTMRIYRELGIDFLLRGHGGELLHMTKAYAFSVDDAALGAGEAGIEQWLFDALTGYMLAGVPDDLFTIDLREGARQSLRQAIERCQPTDRPVDKVWQLFLNERIHRETTLSMHKFNCFATIRQPYLDNDVIDEIFTMAPERKLGDELQTAALRKRRPAFLDVVNANTGAKMGAGPLATTLAKIRLKVFAKLGLKGYQPYERLGLWLRRELRPVVESVLQHERFLDAGLVRPDVVRRVVAQHVANDANHTFLLMSLLIFALGCEVREDPDGFRARLGPV